jgi:C-terminal processing protease CtpA/Prc
VEGFEATLGLFALTRLNVVLDRVGNTIYLKPVTTRTNSYNYNRLGAVFTPRDIKGGDLIARVIKGTPADAAGMRDGDVLLKIGDLDATKWQTDPRILPLSRFWSQPAGTKLDLSYRRQERVTNAIIELKEIFPRAVSPAKASMN